MPRNRGQQEVPDGHVRDERRVIDLRGVRVVQIEGIHIVETPDGTQTGRFTEADIRGYTGRLLAFDDPENWTREQTTGATTSAVRVDPGARVPIEAVQRAVEEVRRIRPPDPDQEWLEIISQRPESPSRVRRTEQRARLDFAFSPLWNIYGEEISAWESVQDDYAKYVAPRLRGMTLDMFSVELLEAQAIVRRLNFPPKPKVRAVQLDIEDPNYLSEQQQIEDC